jgi:hypothetical protein
MEKEPTSQAHASITFTYRKDYSSYNIPIKFGIKSTIKVWVQENMISLTIPYLWIFKTKFVYDLTNYKINYPTYGYFKKKIARKLIDDVIPLLQTQEVLDQINQIESEVKARIRKKKLTTLVKEL